MVKETLPTNHDNQIVYRLSRRDSATKKQNTPFYLQLDKKCFPLYVRLIH